MRQPIILLFTVLFFITWSLPQLCSGQERYQSSLWITNTKTAGFSGAHISSPDSSGSTILAGSVELTNSNYNKLHLSKIGVDGNISWSKDFDIGDVLFTSEVYQLDSVIASPGRLGSKGMLALYYPEKDSLQTIRYSDIRATFLHILPIDGGYVLVGNAFSGSTTQGNVYILKTDRAGTPVWGRTLSARNISRVSDIKQHPNGNVIIVGTSGLNSISNDDNIFALSFDLDGYLHWATFVGGEEDERCAGFAFDNDDLIVAGTIEGYGYDYETPVVYRMNADGELLGATAYETSGNANVDFLRQVEGGELVLGGIIEDGGGDLDNFIVRIPVNISETVINGWGIGGDSTETLSSVEHFQGDILLLGTSRSYESNHFSVTTLMRASGQGEVGCNDYPLRFTPVSVSSPVLLASEWITNAEWELLETKLAVRTFAPDTTVPRLVVGKICVDGDLVQPPAVSTTVEFAQFDSLRWQLSIPQINANGTIYCVGNGTVDTYRTMTVMKFDPAGVPVAHYAYGWGDEGLSGGYNPVMAFPDEEEGITFFGSRTTRVPWEDSYSVLSFMMRLDPQGYHRSTTYLFEFDRPQAVARNSNGGFLLLTDKHLTSLSGSGKVNWAYMLQGKVSATSVRELANNDLLLGGLYIDTANANANYSWLARYDSAAQPLWSFALRREGMAASEKQSVADVRENEDGDILFCGESGERMCVGKVRGDGSLLWFRTYEGVSDDLATQIFPLGDGGGIVFGDRVFFRFDSSGTVLWTKGLWDLLLGGAAQNSDRSFTIVGDFSCPRKYNYGRLTYVAKLDTNGMGGGQPFTVGLHAESPPFLQVDTVPLLWQLDTVPSYDLQNPGEDAVGFAANANCSLFDTLSAISGRTTIVPHLLVEPNCLVSGGFVYLRFSGEAVRTASPSVSLLNSRGQFQPVEYRVIGEQGGETLIEVDTKDLPSGLYFIRVGEREHSSWEKLLIY
ncbi:MAG: hypothetical protein KDD67_14840 [Ignavibacteriae bacterium]|nr:hypothetical protein [Ignavibacteriota bacterium]MCB9215113.1 hypothetical protein [Ignavibacteria bacterium]